jgi:hypothetical protein
LPGVAGHFSPPKGTNEISPFPMIMLIHRKSVLWGGSLRGQRINIILSCL